VKTDILTIQYAWHSGGGHPVELTNDTLVGYGFETSGKLGALFPAMEFILSFEPDLEQDDDPAIAEALITKVEILYDGVTPHENPGWGMTETGSSAQPYNGEIVPMVRFSFDRPVEDSAALQALASSRFQLMTEAMMDAGCDSLMINDESGRCRLIDEDTESVYVEELVAAGVLTRNEDTWEVNAPSFEFPEGMEKYGHVIPWPDWKIGGA
jgi:hypothetical protein